jgi:hypothetical protein
MSALHQIGHAWVTNNHKIQDTASGGTFQQNGLAFGLAVVGAGTYNLPDDGLPMFVQATGEATLHNQSAVTVATLEANTMALCLPLSTTTWAAAFLKVGAGPESVEAPNAKYTTSATTTSVTPAAGTLTGARHVYWESTADGALEVTTRSGAQLYADIDGAFSGMTYLLTIVNRGDNTVTLTGGDDVDVQGENTIATLVTRTYLVSLINTSAVTMRSVSKGTIET